MTLSASTVFEVRTTGADTNGGGFVTGSSGTDWSQQAAPQYAVADVVTNGTTTVTSASANFGADVVGNLAYIGAAWYQIVARTSATAIVVDRTIATATGQTINIGGALLSPGVAAAVATVPGMIVFVKYNLSVFANTTTTVNVAGGRVQSSAGIIWCGYNTTRAVGNTDALQPTFQVQVNSGSMFSASAASCVAWNFVIDGNATANSSAVNSAGVVLINSTVKNCRNNAVQGGICIGCIFTGNGSATVTTGTSIFCIAYGNTSTPFGGFSIDCIAYSNTGATTTGFAPPANTAAINCVAYGNGSHGFAFSSAGTAILVNCYSEANSGYAFASTSTGVLVLQTCGAYSNSSGRINTATVPTVDLGAINLTGSAFVNAAAGNFALNTTAGAGAQLRAASYPATYPGGLTANFNDIGAAQHQDAVLPTVAQVLSGVAFGFGSALTGTVTLPTVAQVLNGITFGPGAASTGTVTLPTAAQVLSGVTFGPGGSSTGTITLPTTAQVLSGVTFGPNGVSTGTVTLPTAAQVLNGITFGAGGGSIGTIVLPTTGQVISGVVFGPGSASTGNVTLPTVGNVKSGVQYGTNGTQYTGTLAGGGGSGIVEIG